MRDDDFFAISNTHGLYNSVQFVLRLSPVNHALMSRIEMESGPKKHMDEEVQAYSTYLHETIHWWQHVGSTVGLVLSLCYPNQTHGNADLLREWASITAPKKSIRGWAKRGELSGKDHRDLAQSLGNTIVNNASDLDFYKRWLMQPGKEEVIYGDPYFESQGHCFWMSYAHLLNNLSPICDPSYAWLPDPKPWDDVFTEMASKKQLGYFYQSPIWRRSVGVREIFEGQASFSQMQFLSGVNRGRDLNYYRKIGLLHGVYEVAFSRFLRMTGLSEPSHLFDSAVNLFLLVCDLSIHPVDGFPCGISSFSRFVFEADPGCRFEYICAAIARDRSSYESCLTKVERDDYFRVSERLMHASNIRHPKEGWDVIQDWSASSPDIRAIMKEKSALNYSSLNMVQRVLLSHFISLTLDRIKHPEFFCWPGYWKTHSEGESWVKELWLKNLSLFSDQENNGGIFIRKFPGIPEENLTKTLDNFFGFNVLFNLVRQWTLEDGPFKFDFAWLSEDHSAIEWQNWAEQLFQEKFGVRISDIGLMK